MKITKHDGTEIPLSDCKGAIIKGCKKHPINAGKQCPDCETEFIKWLMGIMFFGAPKGPQVEVKLDDAKVNDLGP